MILLSPGPPPDLPWLGQGTVVAWLLILPATILGLLLGDSLAWRTVQAPAHQSCRHSSLCLMSSKSSVLNPAISYLVDLFVLCTGIFQSSFKLSSDFFSHGR